MLRTLKPGGTILFSCRPLYYEEVADTVKSMHADLLIAKSSVVYDHYMTGQKAYAYYVSLQKINTCWMSSRPDHHSVTEFKAGPGIQKLDLQFDIKELRNALQQCLASVEFQGGMQSQGFAAIPVTQRPGQTTWTENDLSGRYWIRRRAT